MKKTLVIVGILLIFIAGYFYLNKPRPLQCIGTDHLAIVRIADSTYELRGDIVFRNPNTMRANLGKVDVNITLDEEVVGVIHDEFKTAIKGEERFDFSFQVRFPLSERLLASHDSIPVRISGTGGSDVTFANYTFPVECAGMVKKIW